MAYTSHSLPDPVITIGLSISTSPSTLSLSSDEPFYIVVEARLVTSPHPDKPITLKIFRTPLEDLRSRCIRNPTCTTDPENVVRLDRWSNCLGPASYSLENEGLVTIPPHGQGSYIARHELGRHLIDLTGLKKGEKYRVVISDKGLGTSWWRYGEAHEFKSVRLWRWKNPEMEEEEEEVPYEEKEFRDADYDYRDDFEQIKQYFAAPAVRSEQEGTLSMIREVEAVEFEVVE